MRSTISSSPAGDGAALLGRPTASPTRPHPCGSGGRRRRGRTSGWWPRRGRRCARRSARARGCRSAPWPARRSSGPRGSRRPARPAGRRRPPPARCGRRPGRRPTPCGCPRVMVPVLSRSRVWTSPAASTARPLMASTLRLHQPVHAGDADGREQRADGRRDEADEQRHQDDHRDRGPGVVAEGLEHDDDREEDDRQHGQQDGEGDLVRASSGGWPPRRG